MSESKNYCIVVTIDNVPFYVSEAGTYSTAFDHALRFYGRDAAEHYRAAINEKRSAKVVPIEE